MSQGGSTMSNIFNQITRFFTNKLMNWGMRRATKALSQPSKGTKPGGKPGGTAKAASPQMQQQQKAAREAAKRARQAAQITRRLGR